MREILFRGQTRRYGEKVWMNGEKVPSNWVYGGIFQGIGGLSVIYGANKEDFTSVDIEKHIVYSDTIGQYTGMTDKDGKKIFEGDIVRSYDPDYPESQIDCGVGQVEFFAGLWYVSGEVNNGLYELYTISCKELEVIGNIHDNDLGDLDGD